MPLRKITIETRRGALVLVVLFALAVTSVITALIANVCIKPVAFTPLQFPASMDLANGVVDTNPPQIAAGVTPLTFRPQFWCNNSGHELVVHISITLVNQAAAPLTAVPVLSGFGYLLPKGCSSDYGLPIKPPLPLTPGMWFAEVTVSAVDGGKTQIATVISKPFQVVAAP